MFEISFTILIAVVVALTQIVKGFGINSKYLPLVSLVLGVIGGVVFLDALLKETILYGIIIGLSASGLFDQSKIIKKGD